MTEENAAEVTTTEENGEVKPLGGVEKILPPIEGVDTAPEEVTGVPDPSLKATGSEALAEEVLVPEKPIRLGLDAFKDTSRLGGYELTVMDTLREKYPEKFTESGQMDWKWFEKDIRPNKYIYVRHDKSSLSFTIQNGPIKEVGVNGCQVDTVIEAALHMIKHMNGKFPCKQNESAIVSLEDAITALKSRKKDRQDRGVEGYDKL